MLIINGLSGGTQNRFQAPKFTVFKRVFIHSDRVPDFHDSLFKRQNEAPGARPAPAVINSSEVFHQSKMHGVIYFKVDNTFEVRRIKNEKLGDSIIICGHKGELVQITAKLIKY